MCRRGIAAARGDAAGDGGIEAVAVVREGGKGGAWRVGKCDRIHVLEDDFTIRFAAVAVVEGRTAHVKAIHVERGAWEDGGG